MLEFKPRTSRMLSVAVLVMVALEALGLVYLKELPFSRITVVNTDRAEDLYWTPKPGERNEYPHPEGVTQVIVSQDYGMLRNYRQIIRNESGLDVELDQAKTDLERAVLLRKWARDQYDFNAGSGKMGMFDYEALLRSRIREGSFRESGLCDAFSTLFVGAALSMGLPARIIHLDTTGGTDDLGHYTAEVYLSEHKKWVVMDPLYNCYYTADEQPLSALDLLRRAREGQALVTVTIERDRSTTGPVGLPLDQYYAHFQVVDRTDFETYGLNLFGDRLMFLNWSGDGAGPLGRQEAVLRVVLLFVWPAVVLVVAMVLIIGHRPRTSLLLLAARKPVRPEYRE